MLPLFSEKRAFIPADDAFAGLLSDMIQKQNEKKEEQKVKISLDEILKKADDILPYKAVTTIELPNNFFIFQYPF